jgi:hypothetical protein
MPAKSSALAFQLSSKQQVNKNIFFNSCSFEQQSHIVHSQVKAESKISEQLSARKWRAEVAENRRERRQDKARRSENPECTNST